ncbi:MAG TPA: hypothetical protein PKI03_36720 [Pseudomonadota bacterium]|nr:hypothetical protein [Pseudomonadota bacterium]
MMAETKSTLKLRIVGEQVAAARKLLKMTQVELAAAAPYHFGILATRAAD